MIVGATATPDAGILQTADGLYRRQRLRRVYYSAFSPIPLADARLPGQAPPLLREHRLYQADWLLRFYGFRVDELVDTTHPNLDLERDPKLSWALRHRQMFPVDLNTASREEMLRVPGLGARSVTRIIASRRWRRIRLEDLKKLRVVLKRALPFVVVDGQNPSLRDLDRLDLPERLRPKNRQLTLFDAARSAWDGEV
jgi:predicted DNA-binding helix-hairpin-helix protein